MNRRRGRGEEELKRREEDKNRKRREKGREEYGIRYNNSNIIYNNIITQTPHVKHQHETQSTSSKHNPIQIRTTHLNHPLR